MQRAWRGVMLALPLLLLIAWGEWRSVPPAEAPTPAGTTASSMAATYSVSTGTAEAPTRAGTEAAATAPARPAAIATQLPPRAPPIPPAAPAPPAGELSSAAAPVAGLPQRIRIPALRIDTEVEHVGLAPDGAMDVPKRYDTVGWYALGFRPGELGNAVMAGHLDSKTGPAIFWRLRDLRPGDEVLVTSDDGAERRFLVRELAHYPFDQAPLDRIFGPGDHAALNLITCGGTFDQPTQNYDQRLVVYATLAA